ncbi:MAG: hypothetical protein ACRDSP_12205 [Pseudonocardiaceae bacterium]
MCTTAAQADALWGQIGRTHVGLCLDLLASAIRLGEVSTFASVAVALTTRDTVRAVAISHGSAEVIIQPVDERGRPLELPQEDDMTQLNHIQHLRVLQVSYAGRSACQARAS